MWAQGRGHVAATERNTQHVSDEIKTGSKCRGQNLNPGLGERASVSAALLESSRSDESVQSLHTHTHAHTHARTPVVSRERCAHVTAEAPEIFLVSLLLYT